MSFSRRTVSLFATLFAALLMLTGAANAHAAPAPPAPGEPPHMQDTPGDPSSSTYFRFYTHVSDNIAECRVADDAGAPWTVCQDLNGNGSFEPQLPDGQHTVEIREVDDAGDRSPAYSHTWTLDTIAPGPATITSAPEATTTNTTATFAFTSEPGAYFICDLDGNAGMQHSDDCDSTRTYTGLAVGKHTFKVFAIDAAGNGSPASEYTFTVTAPQPPVTRGRHRAAAGQPDRHGRRRYPQRLAGQRQARRRAGQAEARERDRQVGHGQAAEGTEGQQARRLRPHGQGPVRQGEGHTQQEQ